MRREVAGEKPQGSHIKKERRFRRGHTGGRCVPDAHGEEYRRDAGGSRLGQVHDRTGKTDSGLKRQNVGRQNSPFKGALPHGGVLQEIDPTNRDDARNAKQLNVGIRVFLCVLWGGCFCIEAGEVK